MTKARTLSSIFAILALSLSTGCYESVETTQYEPGVYKGTEDPLLGKIGGTDHHEQLAQRFQNQTDR